MAEHIQIGDVTPRIQYTGDGAQVLFTYPFPIFKAADMEVYLDDALQASGYNVNGAGQSAGGNVTFTTAPANGVVVTLRRRLAIQRTSDFQESGEFRSKVINDELDYQTAALQQVANDQLRSLRQSATEAADIGELPEKATRASNFLAFDAEGDPIASGGTPGAVPVSSFMETVLDDTDAPTARATLGLDTAMPHANLTLKATIAANALTIAVGQWNGQDPTPASPATVFFRSATGNDGKITTRALTAATTLTISAGSTMGAANGEPFRLWIVAIDTGAGVVLGAVRALKATGSPTVLPLRDNIITTSTAEGGAGGADSAHVIYSPTGQVSKPIRILGYMDWSSGLTTAGTWDALPNVVQLYHAGVPLPGDVVQISALTDTTVFTSNSATYVDVTDLALGITPSSPVNGVLARLHSNLGVQEIASEMAGMQFVRGSTPIGGGVAASNRWAAAGATGYDYAANTQRLRMAVDVEVFDLPATAGAVTYKAQARNNSGTNNFRVNASGDDGDTTSNPRSASSIILQEIQS